MNPEYGLMSTPVQIQATSRVFRQLLNLRMYFPQELDALLKYNGMKIDEKFGNWDRGVFGPDSRHQLYFCTTTETG